MPPDPLEPFLLLNQFQLRSAKKKMLEKNVEIMAPPFKIFRYATGGPTTITKKHEVNIMA